MLSPTNILIRFVWLLLYTKFLEAKECGSTPASCPLNDIFYSIDGTCNNIFHPGYGSSRSTYDRLVIARYGDGVKTIRKSVLGGPLPNSRYLRLKLLEDFKQLIDLNLTRAVIGSCQFFAHDLSKLDLAYAPDSCCTDDMQKLSYPGPYCASVDIPADDPVYCETCANCMSVVNAKTNLDYYCSITPQAQQISIPTPFADLSPIYGYDADSHYKVRLYVDGKLKYEIRNGYSYLTINPDKYSCHIPCGSDDECLLSGDPDVNQHLDLTAFNTLWMREHNRLCDKLKYYNPCWEDEKLFQTARRINIAIHQWMFYFELLPLILGKYVVEDTGVAPFPLFIYTNDYDPTCKPNVFNEFANYAFRALHAQIRGTIFMADEYRNAAGKVFLPYHMEHTKKFLEECDNFDEVLRGACTQNSHQTGCHQDFIVSNSLFLRKLKYAIDLITIDIHRGRLNGLGTYNDIRVYCGYPRAKTFEDFYDLMPAEKADKLKAEYKHPDDVDALIGSRLETKVKYSLVGPTLQCVLVKQFLRTRRCDRLWFEHKEAGFNEFQLTSIRLTSTLARFICNNGNSIKKMQPHAFEPISLLNPLTDCEFLPQLDVSLWKDPACYI